MKKVFYFVLIVLCFSCKKKEEVKPESKNEANHYFYNLMKEWYLWNDKIPQVDPDSYSTPEALLEALKYKTYDKWSLIMDSAAFAQYFSSGQTAGYGCGLKLNYENRLFVSYVYANSSMSNAGVTRGFEITHVNGSSVDMLLSTNLLNNELQGDGLGSTTRFTMISTEGVTKDYDISISQFQANSVLHYEVKEVDAKKVGYLVFNSFIGTSKSELNKAFSYFQSNGVTELVLDLRYNGGGLVDVANYLASNIAGSKGGNGVFGYLTHNPGKASYDLTWNFETPSYNLGLDQVIIITSDASASSSELVINNLKPYMNVQLVGSKTHGKPVGMYNWNYKGKTIVPITFEMSNSNRSGKYFGGIDVNFQQFDDLSEPFGDTEEECLKSALQYIKSGSFTGNPARIAYNTRKLEQTGFKALIGVY